MPQFDPSVFAPQLVWLLIVFTAFYFLMARLALPRIGRVLEERDETIADYLDQAEQLGRDADKVQENFEGTLAEARAKAMRHVQEARAEAQKDLAHQLRVLETKLERQAKAAEERIAKERRAAMGQLEQVAVEACGDIVARLLGGAARSDAAVAAAVKAEIAARERA